MRHVADGVLRRLVDEPLAVPDDDVEHVERCRRCQAHRDRARRDARAAQELLARPQSVPDVDRAWERLNGAGSEPAHRVPRRIRPRPFAGAAGVTAMSGVLVAGVAAAATLTVVFSPDHVAPVPVSKGDVQGLANVLGLDRSGLWSSGSRSVTSTGPSTVSTSATSPSGTQPWKYGTIQWAARPRPVAATSLSAAESAAGMTVRLPTTLPAGVQGPPKYLVVGPASVTVTFDASAGPSLAGSTLTLRVGPGILAEYGGAIAGVGNMPTLAVATMQRPTAASTGATTTQLESFVLDRSGFPQDLAQEIRLLGNLRTTLPVPVPTGVTETTTTIAGSPAVMLSMGGGTATAVVWEDRTGIVRTVGGLLDRQDVLGVARQLG